ncbi:MAG: sarcosine oxidase subunit delta [Thermodesulfobacteriota bacterium]|nr:sarcosine oxidase subunit delta [Thermodesulfobacteriota bacterium]
MSFTITCPVCGRRNLYEFRFGGEDRGPRPEERDLTPEAWAEWAMMNDNVSGVQKEWWYHRDGCGVWFTVHRDTRTNREVPTPEVAS